MMERFVRINQMFWNGSAFEYFFYSSVFLIIVFEKRKMHKIVFGIFPVVMLIGIFNPLTSFIVTSVFRRTNAYYVRLFSIVPVFYCMSYGVTLLLNKVSGLVKMLGVCAIVAFIVIIGHCVYKESWMQRAENLMKTPNDVYEVFDVIPHEKENMCIAFPDPLYLYARQVDGDVLMPYGRLLGGPSMPMLQELRKSVPDVDVLMSMAGGEDVDYVVVNKTKETRDAFQSRGYMPIGETTQYSVYPVAGVQRIDRTLNEKRQIVAITSLDADGKPAYNNSSVLTTIRNVYDKWGNKTEERYYNKDDRRVTTIEGYSGRRRSYILHGLDWFIYSTIYLDTEDRPLLASGRFETRYRFVKHREIIEESYYDAQGQTMNRVDTGYAVSLQKYDKRSRLISEKYFDTARNPVMCYAGYAGFTREYDNENRVLVEKYFDTQDKPVNISAGFATWNRTYDDLGNLVSEDFFDAYGNAVDIKGKVKRDLSYDLLQQAKKESVANSVGIGYKWILDGSCTVTGDAEGISWNNIFMGDRPYYFIPGETYRVQYTAESVDLRIYFYQNSTWTNRIDDLSTLCDTEFTVPQNCGAMIIRLWVAPGTDVNETVHPRIFIK